MCTLLIHSKGMIMKVMIIVQMFRILFDLPRSLILNKDLLLHVNPCKTLKKVHTKIAWLLVCFKSSTAFSMQCYKAKILTMINHFCYRNVLFVHQKNEINQCFPFGTFPVLRSLSPFVV